MDMIFKKTNIKRTGMKPIYFDCPRKGKVLAIIFTNPNDITANNLKQFMDYDVDRYIKIILKQDGMMVSENAIHFELDNELIISKRRELLWKDMEDMIKVRDLMGE
jgi:hypothetical protein